MDILSLIGLVLATCAILIGAVLKGAGIKALLSAAAFMIVVVGTIAAICVQTPLPVMKHAIRILPWVFQAAVGGAQRPDQEDGRLEQHRAQAGTAWARTRHRQRA
jgi:flagellar motor component MotA